MGEVSRRGFFAEVVGRAAEAVADWAGVRMRTLDELDALDPDQFRRLVLRRVAGSDLSDLDDLEVELASKADGALLLADLLPIGIDLRHDRLRAVVRALVERGILIPQEPLPKP